MGLRYDSNVPQIYLLLSVGSIVIGKAILPLIELVGLPLTFIVLGSFYFVAMTIAAFIFRVPPPGYTVITTSDAERKASAPLMPENAEIKLTLKQSIKSIDFWFLYVNFFTNSLFGLLIISRLADMTTKLYLRAPSEASTIVSINSALNLTGRLLFSTLSDKIGRRTGCLIMLVTQTIIIATFPIFMENRNYSVFLGCMFVISMCYGGGVGYVLFNSKLSFNEKYFFALNMQNYTSVPDGYVWKS